MVGCAPERASSVGLWNNRFLTRVLLDPFGMIDAWPLHKDCRGWTPMNSNKNPPGKNHKKQATAATDQIKYLTKELSREDLRLGLPPPAAAGACGGRGV